MTRALFAAIALLFGGSALAGDVHDVEGVWATTDGGGHVKIEACGEDSICGTLVWFSALDNGEGPYLDDNNKDEALRDRPILGLQMLEGFERRNKGWRRGTIYDPESGNTYASKLTLRDDGVLQVDGCVLFICRAEYWTRVDEATT